MKDSFTSVEVAKLAGITLRQLQWWDEQDIVAPSRLGHRRIYTLDDLAEIAIICDLRRRGFSLQKIRRVVSFLQKELGRRLVETVSAAAEYHLLTDGRHIYLEDSARGVVNLLKNSQQPMLSVCLSDTIQRVLNPIERGAGAQRRAPVRAESRPGGKRPGPVRHPMERRGKAC